MTLPNDDLSAIAGMATPTDEINCGGPAYPIPAGGYIPAPTDPAYDRMGLTKRDWFAAQVVSSMIHLSICKNDSWDLESAAYNAYAMADAMLKARSQ